MCGHTEIATHYGEVFWTDQSVLPLPDDIVKRFAGKVIAITGYEQDQVMVQPTGQAGKPRAGRICSNQLGLQSPLHDVDDWQLFRNEADHHR